MCHPMQITLVEANEVLGSFDARLKEYAVRKLVREGVHLIRGVVKASASAAGGREVGRAHPNGHVCMDNPSHPPHHDSHTHHHTQGNFHASSAPDPASPG